MEKVISLQQPIATIVKQYPELIGILYQIGFTEIVKPVMLATVGKFMTLTSGASFRHIDIEVVRQALRANGFTLMEE